MACGSDIRGARSLLVLHQRRDREVVLEANGREFGTAPTCLAFMQLEKSEGAENGMASPPESPTVGPFIGGTFRAA